MLENLRKIIKPASLKIPKEIVSASNSKINPDNIPVTNNIENIEFKRDFILSGDFCPRYSAINLSAPSERPRPAIVVNQVTSIKVIVNLP